MAESSSAMFLSRKCSSHTACAYASASENDTLTWQRVTEILPYAAHNDGTTSAGWQVCLRPLRLP